MNKNPKPKLFFTRLNKARLLEGQFRIDNILGSSSDLTYKVGDILSSEELNKIIQERKLVISKIEADNLISKS